MNQIKLAPLAFALALNSSLSAQLHSYDYCGFPSCGTQGSLQVDYLLWFPYLDGLSHSTQITENAINSPLTTVKEDDNFFRNQWNSGARAALILDSVCNDWEFRAGYTYFFAKVKNDRRTFPSSALLGNSMGSNLVGEFLINPLFSSQNATFSSSRWKLNFSQLDIDLTKNFCVTSDVQFCPLFGVKTLWLNHTFSTLGSPGTLSGLSTGNVILREFDARSHYCGVGPQAGFDTRIDLFSCFELVGHLSGSVLWGYLKVQESLTQSEGGLPTSLPSVKQRHSNQTAVFNLSTGLTLLWRWDLYTVKLGWEQHMYSNINRIQNVINTASTNTNLIQDSNVQRGYLSLSGFTFGLSYEF